MKQPILLLAISVNQTFPSGPAVIPRGSLPAEGRAYSAIVPSEEILAILLVRDSVNQRLPSGPKAMPDGSPLPSSRFPNVQPQNRLPSGPKTICSGVVRWGIVNSA